MAEVFLRKRGESEEKEWDWMCLGFEFEIDSRLLRYYVVGP